MFGVSLGEIAIVALVVLLVVGPDKLPQMLRSLGAWMRKLRIMTTEVRTQTGIDDMLREEGLEGGLAELRSMIRGDLRGIIRGPHVPDPYGHIPAQHGDPHPDPGITDRYREFPPEGVDAAGAIPDDLLEDDKVDESAVLSEDDGAPTPDAPSEHGGAEEEGSRQGGAQHRG